MEKVEKVVKRNGETVDFNSDKIFKAVEAAFKSCNVKYPENLEYNIIKAVYYIKEQKGTLYFHIEDIQDAIVKFLMEYKYFDVVKSFILYRAKHEELRIIKERAEYIEKYVNKENNAATSSEIDANANIQNKNVATLEAELYKKYNSELSRYRVVKKLKELYKKDCPNYIEDLNSHVIYKHDEGSAPAIKPYCVAVNMYPFIMNGTSTLDKLGSKAPNNLTSFAGQFGNLVFLLSSQFQGAIAFGEFFNVFNYYCVKEFGEDFYLHTEDKIYQTKNKCRTIKDVIIQTFQGVIYTINQPAGNRSYQSPFTNISYYDSNYWRALFEHFVYPDGTKPKWESIDYLQRLFMKWFNKEREKVLLTFPVKYKSAA